MMRNEAVVEITAQIRAKVFVDKILYDETGELTLADIAQYRLSELLGTNYLSEHAQIGIETIYNRQVLETGPFAEEGVECIDCQETYLLQNEIDFMANHDDLCMSCHEGEI